MFDMQHVPIPSGIYLCQPLVWSATQITNPFYPGASPVEPEEVVTGPEIEALYKSIKDDTKCVVMHRPIIMDYGVELVRAARIIREWKYELVLCPLRGARLPGIQARVMLDNADSFRPFDGTGMAQGFNDDRILRELRGILFASSSPTEPRRIGVLDTAKGGDSCRSLAKLLGQLNTEVRQAWEVRFHLLHAADRKPPRASEAYQFRSAEFQVDIEFHPVADLLIEDEPHLLGYDTQSAGLGTFSHRLQQDGRILYRDGKQATLFRKAPLDETMIGIVSKEISEHIQTLPDAELVDPDRWKAYKNPS